MPIKNKTSILAIIDKSGSMNSVRDDSIVGFNRFLNDQKQIPGKCDMTLILFSDYNKINIVYENENIQDIPELTDKTYSPSGVTALWDAMGEGIDNLGRYLSGISEDNRPEKIIVCILTDGMENNSQKIKDKNIIAEKVKHQQEKYNWEFIFLAANQDAVLSGQSMGLKADNCMNYQSTGIGTRTAYDNLSRTVSSIRKS